VSDVFNGITQPRFNTFWQFASATYSTVHFAIDASLASLSCSTRQVVRLEMLAHFIRADYWFSLISPRTSPAFDIDVL
jgi:hypothetical protein